MLSIWPHTYIVSYLDVALVADDGEVSSVDVQKLWHTLLKMCPIPCIHTYIHTLQYINPLPNSIGKDRKILHTYIQSRKVMLTTLIHTYMHTYIHTYIHAYIPPR